MDVRSEDEFSNMERPSTSRAVSPKQPNSRYKSRKSSNSKSPSPSDRRMSSSKHKSSSKSKSPSPGHGHTSLFDKRKNSPRSKSHSPSHKHSSFSKRKSFSRSKRRKSLSNRKSSSNSKSPSPSNRRKRLSKRKDKEDVEYVDLVDDDDTINKSSQRNIDLSFIDVEEKVDALDGIAVIASRYTSNEDDANISKSSQRRMDLFFMDVEEKVGALAVQRHVESSFMDVEERVNALHGIAAIASRYASKQDNASISKSSQRHDDSSFMDVEDRVDALHGIAAIASRYASKEDNASISKSSQRHDDSSFMNVEDRVDALDGIAAIASRYVSKEDNVSISKSSQRNVDSSFLNVEDRVDALDGIAAIASRYANKEDNATISNSSKRHLDLSFMDVEDKVDALDGIAAIASRYASKLNTDTSISKGKSKSTKENKNKEECSSIQSSKSSISPSEKSVNSKTTNKKQNNCRIPNVKASRNVNESGDINRSDCSSKEFPHSGDPNSWNCSSIDGPSSWDDLRSGISPPRTRHRHASKEDNDSISKSSQRNVDTSFLNIEDRVDALDGIAAIASRYASKEDNATISNSSKRHVDLSFMDVEDKVDALDGIAAIASRYASKMNTDTSLSKGKSKSTKKNTSISIGKGKSTKKNKTKDVSSSIQSSNSSISPSENTVNSKTTNKKQNNYRIPKLNESRNVNESGDINRSDGSYKEFTHSGDPNSWNYSSIEGPSSWDDLRSDISPPRTRHIHHFENVHQNRKLPSEFIRGKKRTFPNEDLNSWDDLRPYDWSHKRRGSSIPPPQKNVYLSDKNIRDDDLRLSISPRNKITKYKKPFHYEDINSWDDFRPNNEPYNKRCSSIPPRQTNVYSPNKRGSSICPPQKRAYSPSEEPQNWDDLRSYNPLSSRGKYTSKVSMGKYVSEEEIMPTREASSLPTLLSVPTCHICKKYFKTKFIFMKHLKFCDAFRTCFSCNKVLETNANLQQHLTDTGHAKPTSSLETWKYISVKKFKSLFANRDVVEETEFCSESEIVKNLKEISENKSTNDCSIKSIDRHSNEDDNTNKEEDQYLNCEENDLEIENFLNVQRKSHVDESYFEEKEERNCLDGVAALFSRFKANPSSDVSKEKQKLIENVDIKDKELDQETMIEHSISNLSLNIRKKKQKLIDNVDMAEKVEQELMIKQPKRLTAKDFFSHEDQFLDEDSITIKNQERETQDVDNGQTNNDDMTNINPSINEECDIDSKKNNDIEITEKHSEENDLEFDICVEENSANKHSNECENVTKSSGPSIRAPHDKPKFSFIGFDTNESDNDIDEEISETDSFKEFFESGKKDVLKVSDSDCEIVEPNKSNEASDDDSNVNNIIENKKHESILEKFIEKSIDGEDNSTLSKQRKNAKKIINIDEDDKKQNRRNIKNINEDSELFEKEKTNLKNKLVDNNINGTNILKYIKKGKTTIVEVTDLIEKCPRCSQQIDITTLVFNLKTGKMSFWCRFCSLLMVKVVQSGPCSNTQEKSNSSKLKVKTGKLHNKKKDIKKVKKNQNPVKVNTYKNKNIKQVNNKIRKTEKSNKVVRKRGRPKKNNPVFIDT